MADRDHLSHGIGTLPTTSKNLDGNSEEPPSYTEATQHTQRIQGPEDLLQVSHQSPNVLQFKLEEPQVPATSRKMKQLLDGDNIIKIYSCSPGRQNIAVAEAESDLFEYFSGNVVDWTNYSLGVCYDSVSTYLVDWMKAGGRIPTTGPSALAYWEKDLEWLEQLYTIAENLWIRKLMKQTAKEIDRFNGNDKKMQILAAKREKRESAVREAIKFHAKAPKEADQQKKWLAKHLTHEEKTRLDLRLLNINDEGARRFIADIYQQAKADESLTKQQKEASKEMAKQRRQMEKALTEQLRREKGAALMLRCKRLVGKVGYGALKLAGRGILGVGYLALLALRGVILGVGEVVFTLAKVLWFLLALVSLPIALPIILVLRKISDY